MDTKQMRIILKKQYNGARKWQTKVDNMSDSQVQAVYFRMLRAGKLYST